MTMPGVEKLLQQFIEDDRHAGLVDPEAYLRQVEGADRTELETLIDGYLARARRRPFDVDAFEHSPARQVAEELDRVLGGVSGTWPTLLPRLRHRAQLRRADVIRRLAQELDADAEQVDKVARYYHEMERGTLPASGVSDRVLTALGRAVGVTAERLREAGRTAGGAGQGAVGGAPFARVGSPDPQYVEAQELMGGPTASQVEPRDKIDDLFTSAHPD